MWLSAGPLIVCVVLAIVFNILYMYAMSSFTETLCMIALVVYELILLAGMAGGAYMITQP